MNVWAIKFTFHNVSINTNADSSCSRIWVLFTFHNVSINTTSQVRILPFRLYLHSTMFLLIQLKHVPQLFGYFDLHSTMFLLIRGILFQNPSVLKFTFHNVSINTGYTPGKLRKEKLHLHSTMFLLIHIDSFCRFPLSKFTFHNVSINTHPSQSLILQA